VGLRRAGISGTELSVVGSDVMLVLGAMLLGQITGEGLACYTSCPVASSGGRGYCPSVCGEGACCRRDSGWSGDGVECSSRDAGCDGGHCCATIPAPSRTVFAYWNTDNLPVFQRQCLDNWARYNPTWTIRLLTMANAPGILGSHMLPPTWLRMAPQLQSDAVRLAALRLFGGAWVDITTLFTRQGALEEMWEEMVSAGKTMRAYTWNAIGDHLVDSYFIMAQRGSSLVAQWHDIFMTYWQTRTVSNGIEDHDLFEPVSGWGEMRGMVRAGKVDYWSIHVCFLRVQALDENNDWSSGSPSWMHRAYVQNGADYAYYHISRLCSGLSYTPQLSCMANQMFRTDLPLSSIASHTPLLKFHGGMTDALDVGTDDKFMRIFSGSRPTLLAQLLRPPTPSLPPDAPISSPPPSPTTPPMPSPKPAPPPPPSPPPPHFPPDVPSGSPETPPPPPSPSLRPLSTPRPASPPLPDEEAECTDSLACSDAAAASTPHASLPVAAPRGGPPMMPPTAANPWHEIASPPSEPCRCYDGTAPGPSAAATAAAGAVEACSGANSAATSIGWLLVGVLLGSLCHHPMTRALVVRALRGPSPVLTASDAEAPETISMATASEQQTAGQRTCRGSKDQDGKKRDSRYARLEEEINALEESSKETAFTRDRGADDESSGFELEDGGSRRGGAAAQ